MGRTFFVTFCVREGYHITYAVQIAKARFRGNCVRCWCAESIAEISVEMWSVRMCLCEKCCADFLVQNAKIPLMRSELNGLFT